MLDQLPISVDGWLPWLFAAVVLGHLAVTLALHRFARRGRPEADDPGAVDGAVDCPRCGAENDPGYRYCRRCVEELPAAAGFGRPGDDAGPAVP